MKQFLIFILLLVCNLTIWAQSEIFISNERKEINQVTIDAGNCSETTIVTTSVSLSDITLHPDGNMYGVNFTSRKLYRVNMTNGLVDEILTISEADKLVGMTADANGVIYITEGDVVPSRLFTVDLGTNTYESKGYLEHGSAGDLTWYFGKLYNASDNNKLVEVDVEDAANSVVVADFTGVVKAGDRIFALVTVIEGCDNSATYGLSEKGDYYRLDMNTGIVDRLCIGSVDLYGATSADEFSASECFVVMDLDSDNSSGATESDYQDDFDCPSTSSPIADNDVQIEAAFLVDSLYISFVNGIEDDTEEYLEVGSIAGINVNSAVHRIKAYNSGTATLSDFEDLLRSATYRNIAFPATPGTRQIEVIAFSEGRSDTALVTIELTGVDAGEDGAIDYCSTSSASDLFDELGGNPPTGGTWQPTLNSNSGVFDPAIDTAGTYYYFVSDGCFLDSAAVVVTLAGGIDFDLGNDTTLCNESSFEVNSGVSAPGAVFNWSTGENTASINVTQTGNYSLTVTLDGCASTRDIDVTFFNAAVDLGPDQTICDGSSATLDADIGVAGTTYLWNTGAVTAQITVTDTGNYSVVLTNGDCQASDTIHIGFFEPSLELGNDTTLCQGDSILLNADIGLAGATYTWSTGATTSQIYASANGNYAVTVVNGDCQEQDDIDITVTPITFDLGNDIALCPGDSALLDATAQEGGVTYSWNTGETSAQIYASSANEYAVTVTNGACSITDSVNVSIVSASLDLGNDINLCEGDSTLLDASVNDPSFGYVWSTGATTPQIYVSTSGTYSVVVSNGSCSFSDEIEVTVDNDPDIIFDLGNDTTICDDATLTLSSGFATSTYNHLWSNGSTDANITVTEAGVYSLTLSNSCKSGSDDITIFTENCDTITYPVDTFEAPCQIIFPMAFSPNNDGNNDLFRPVNSCPEIVSIAIRIYNRYGEEVFSSENIAWDGTFKNEFVPMDNFTWYAVYTYEDGTISEEEGNVIVLK